MWTRRPASRSSTSCSTRPSRRAPAAGPSSPRSTSASPVGHRRVGLRPGAVRARGPARCRPATCPAGRRHGPCTTGSRSPTTSGQALYASKVVAYAQGFDMIAAAAEEYGWEIDRAAVAPDLAWRLHHPRAVPRPDLRRLLRRRWTCRALLFDPSFVAPSARVRRLAPGRGRGRVAPASRHPASRRRSRTTTGCAAQRLPAALIQGLRDLFGAHTYSGSTATARSTPSGRRTASRRSRPDRHGLIGTAPDRHGA